MDGQRTYAFGAATVSSAMELDELAVSSASPVLRVDRGSIPPVAQWERSWQSRDGVTTHRLARRDGELVVEFSDRITCLFPTALDRVVVDSERPDNAVARAITHRIFPLAFAQRGNTVIHASSVCIDGATIAICGPPAAGKSTLAAALVCAGGSMLGDDSLWLERRGAAYLGHRTTLGTWLRTESCDALAIDYGHASAGDKVHVLRDRSGPEVARIDAVICLVDEDDPAETAIDPMPMSAANLYFALYDQLFQLDPSDRAVARRSFEHITDAAGAIPGWRMNAPYEFEQLDHATRVLRDVARSVAPREARA